MNAEQEVEKKLGMSLDELIAAQSKKKAAGGKPKAGVGGGSRIKKAGIQKVQQTKGGGRVLVVPRPKHVPRPSSGGSAAGNARMAAALKVTRGGGVHKGGPAPKFMGGGQGQQMMGGGGGTRNVKVTIGNKLSGRPPSHLPTSGVLAKPFMVSAGSAGRSGRAPMMMDGGNNGGSHLPSGANLSTRFDSFSGRAPSRPAPTGEPRRNAHGVLIP